MIPLGSHPAWHGVFEAAAYIVTFLLYRHIRARTGDQLTDGQRWNVLAAAAIGALIGSRLLDRLYDSPEAGMRWSQFLAPSGGKTIVGGLLGGWIAVELAKRVQGIQPRTGDLFSVPLCIGIAIGRIGCLLTGLAEDTYGKPTGLAWGVDFGDGIPRHPTQAYEIVFVLLLCVFLKRMQDRPHANGLLFRLFMAFYLSFRLVIDFLKPAPLWHGMSVIQWSCALALIVLWIDWPAPAAVMRPEHAE